MKKIVFGIIGVVILLIIFAGCNGYNSLVKMDVDVCIILRSDISPLLGLWWLSALMMGTTPDICANYNSVVMNEAFIQEHVKDTFELMDDL
mgnify:CR=1 FL=1